MPNGGEGMGRRQCTNEYKLKPIDSGGNAIWASEGDDLLLGGAGANALNGRVFPSFSGGREGLLEILVPL